MSRQDVPRWNSSEFLDSIVRDLRFAVRGFRKRPAFMAVALLTLALGISATTVMFTVINGVLLKPLSYPSPEQLFTLRESTEKYGALWVSYPDFLDCQQQSHTLTLAAWSYVGGLITEPGEPQYVESRQISPELFSVLEIPLVRGRSFLPEENRTGSTPVVVISYHLWQNRFGGREDAVGSKLTFDSKSYMIVGIAPARFQLDGQPDVFTPLGQSTEPKMQNREANFLHAVGRLRPGATSTAAQAELSQIAGNLARSYPASNAGRTFTIQPLLQEVVGNVSSILWLLLGAVGLLLLIACANVASLLLSRAVSRQREFAVQIALGAGRGRVIRQCLTESSVLGLAGGALGVLLAWGAMRPFLLMWPGNLPRIDEIHLDWHVLVFAFAISWFSALLFGLAPALRAPTRNVEPALRASARTMSGNSRRLHSAFVVSQVALALLLLISAGMLGRTVIRLSSLDPGLELKNVLVSHLAFSPGALSGPAQTRAAWQQLIDTARQVPGVRSVALTDIVPMRQSLDEVGYWTSDAQPAPKDMPLALESIVTPDYLKVMGISLRAGRFFNEDDRLGGNPVSVIDEVLAHYAFKGQDPIGKRLSIQGVGPTQIIGVVGHIRHWGLANDDQAKVRAEVYQPLAFLPDRMTGFFSSFLSITVRTDVAPLNIAEVLQEKMRSVPGTPVMYDITTMEQLASATLARERFLVLLFGVFAGLALLLACVGIYGVMAYLTSQRIPEIGIRMALGASPSNILQLILKQSLGMVLVGAIVGILAALATGRLLLHLVDGMQATEPLTIAVMIALLVGAALLASFVPALRASRLNAVQALRSE